MKHDWKITLILKCGKEIAGILKSEHNDSGKVYEQIFSDMTEHEREEKWVTILASKTETVSVKFKEIAAIRLGL